MTVAELKPPVEFDPTVVSPSRIQALTQCGTAFRMKYVDGMKPEKSGSAALFGQVCHRALEWWTPDRSQPLLPLMRKAWLDVTAKEPAVQGFIAVYAPLATEAIRTKHEITEKRTAQGIDTKNVSMTKAWKESSIAKKVNAFVYEWLPQLADSQWRFSERDPLPNLYDESLPLAKRYEAKWGHLPNSFATERRFDIPWRGFKLTGVIDCFERLYDRPTQEPLGIGITDYKTYAKDPAEQKDWRQFAVYFVAFRELVERGEVELPDGINLDTTPLYVGADYVRLGRRQYFRVLPPDLVRLERELNDYQAIVTGGHFLPAEKGRNPDFCDFPSACCLRNCKGAGGAAEAVELDL